MIGWREAAGDWVDPQKHLAPAGCTQSYDQSNADLEQV